MRRRWEISARGVGGPRVVGRQSNGATAEKAGVGQAGASLDYGRFLVHAVFAISRRRDAVGKHEGNYRQREHENHHGRG